MRCMADSAVLGEGFFQVVPFCNVCIIPPKIYTHFHLNTKLEVKLVNSGNLDRSKDFSAWDKKVIS
jgi:hypothetical protein